MDKELIRTGDNATVTFEFKFKPEFIELNNKIIFREGNTKGVGTIIKTYQYPEKKIYNIYKIQYELYKKTNKYI